MKSLSNYKPYDVMYIDAMNLLTRSYHGMSTLEYRGHKTGMLYGVVRLVLDWRRRNPDIEIVMLWEGKDSWRKAKHPIYKAHRGDSRSSDDAKEFFDCIDRVKYALPSMGIYQLWADTYEADDVAYAMSLIEARRGRRALFSSGDWDWWELCDRGDILYQHKDVCNREELDVMFEKKYNVPPVPPDTLWLFKVLTGDPSDNVSGIPRFPKKVASALCNTGMGDGSVIHGLISLGETTWAQRVTDNYWIVERNTELLKSYDIPLDDVSSIAPCYDVDAFGETLLKSGMESLHSRLQEDSNGTKLQ